LLLMVSMLAVVVTERNTRVLIKLRERDIEIAEARVDIEVEAVFGIYRKVESRIGSDRVQA
jgi:hypothetical protein